MSATIFIFGFGYTAEFLALKLSQSGFNIIGTTRDNKKIRETNDSNIRLLDFFDEKIADYLSNATHVLISIPPLEKVGDIVLANYTEYLKCYPNLQWLGYLSSTGVYGDHDGGWGMGR